MVVFISVNLYFILLVVSQSPTRQDNCGAPSSTALILIAQFMRVMYYWGDGDIAIALYQLV